MGNHPSCGHHTRVGLASGSSRSRRPGCRPRVKASRVGAGILGLPEPPAPGDACSLRPGDRVDRHPAHPVEAVKRPKTPAAAAHPRLAVRAHGDPWPSGDGQGRKIRALPCRTVESERGHRRSRRFRRSFGDPQGAVANECGGVRLTSAEHRPMAPSQNRRALLGDDRQGSVGSASDVEHAHRRLPAGYRDVTPCTIPDMPSPGFP